MDVLSGSEALMGTRPMALGADAPLHSSGLGPWASHLPSLNLFSRPENGTNGRATRPGIVGCSVVLCVQC